MFRSIAVLVLAALALAGCSRVEAAPAPSAGMATPNLPCSLPYGTTVALLSPVPGSTGVSAGLAPVVLVASRDLPKTVTAVAVSAKGTATLGSPLERTAKPVHAAPSPWANPVYYRAPALNLRAKRHYTIALDDLAQNGCAPYVKIAGDARFST
jgi:hypothetical protein